MHPSPTFYRVQMERGKVVGERATSWKWWTCLCGSAAEAVLAHRLYHKNTAICKHLGCSPVLLLWRTFPLSEVNSKAIKWYDRLHKACSLTSKAVHFCLFHVSWRKIQWLKYWNTEQLHRGTLVPLLSSQETYHDRQVACSCSCGYCLA